MAVNKKKPTDKQIKEFWEWCGWSYKPDELCGSPRSPHIKHSYGWHAPDNYDYHPFLPKLDLNNLFKYAVPKLYDDMVYGRIRDGEFDESDYIDLIAGWAESVARDKKDPALALFWAIYEVIKG